MRKIARDCKNRAFHFTSRVPNFIPFSRPHSPFLPPPLHHPPPPFSPPDRDKGATASPFFPPDRRFTEGVTSATLVIPGIVLLLGAIALALAAVVGWMAVLTRPVNIVALATSAQAAGPDGSPCADRPLPSLQPRGLQLYAAARMDPRLVRVPFFASLAGSALCLLSVVSWIAVSISPPLGWALLDLAWAAWIGAFAAVCGAVACAFFAVDLWRRVDIREAARAQLNAHGRAISAGFDRRGIPRRSMDFTHLGHPTGGSTPERLASQAIAELAGVEVDPSPPASEASAGPMGGASLSAVAAAKDGGSAGHAPSVDGSYASSALTGDTEMTAETAETAEAGGSGSRSRGGGDARHEQQQEQQRGGTNGTGGVIETDPQQQSPGPHA